MRRAEASHLVHRFAGSLSRREPARDDVEWARSTLLADEMSVWSSMSVQDRRHSIMVARRFDALCPDATRAERRGALLHDVGKTVSGLGTLARVVATLVGPRTGRFRDYLDHERIGAAMLAGCSDPDTVRMVARAATVRTAAAEALTQADNT